MSKAKILELTPENFTTFLKKFSSTIKSTILTTINLSQFKTCSDEVRRQCAKILLDEVEESFMMNNYTLLVPPSSNLESNLLETLQNMRKNFECNSHEFAALANEILCRHSKRSDNGKTFMVHLTELIELEMKKSNVPSHRVFVIGDFLCCLYNLSCVKDSLVWKWIQHQMRTPDDVFVHWFDFWLKTIEDRMRENNPRKLRNWQEQLKNFIKKRGAFWTFDAFQKDWNSKEKRFIGLSWHNMDAIHFEIKVLMHLLIRQSLNNIGNYQSVFVHSIESMMKLPWLSAEERNEEIRKCIVYNSHFYFYDRELSKDQLFERVKFILDLHRESVISDNVLRDIVGRILESAKFNRDVAKVQLKAISQFWGEQKCKEFFGEENAKNIMELTDDSDFTETKDKTENVLELTSANFKLIMNNLGPKKNFHTLSLKQFKNCSDEERNKERRSCAEIFLDVMVDSDDGINGFRRIVADVNKWFSLCSANQKSFIVHLTDWIDLKKDNAYKPCFRTYRIGSFLSELYAYDFIKESTVWKWLEYQMQTPDVFFVDMFKTILLSMESTMKRKNPLILEKWEKKLNSFFDLNPDWSPDFLVPHNFNDASILVHGWRTGSHHQILSQIIELEMPTKAHVRFVATSLIAKAIETDISRSQIISLLLELPWSKNGEFQRDIKKSIVFANSCIYKYPVCEVKIRKIILFIADLHTRTVLTDETLQDLFNVFIESALYGREFAQTQLKMIHQIFGEKKLKKILGKNQTKVIVELLQKNFKQAGTSKILPTVKPWNQNIETGQPTFEGPQTNGAALSTQTNGDAKGSSRISESSTKPQISPQRFIESLWKNILENPERTKALANFFKSTVKSKTIKGLHEDFIEFLQRRIDTFASISSEHYTDKIRNRLEGVMTFIAEIYVLDLITEEILRTFLKSIENLTLISPNKFISVIESRNVQESSLMIELLEMEHKKSLEFWQDLKKEVSEIQESIDNHEEPQKDENVKKEINCRRCNNQQN